MCVCLYVLYIEYCYTIYIYIFRNPNSKEEEKKNSNKTSSQFLGTLCARTLSLATAQIVKCMRELVAGLVCQFAWLSFCLSFFHFTLYNTIYISMRCECVCAQFIRSDFGCLCLQPQYRSALAWTNKIYRKMVIFISGNRRCAWTLSNRHNDQSTICEHHRTVGCDYIALSPQHQPSYRNIHSCV